MRENTGDKTQRSRKPSGVTGARGRAWEHAGVSLAPRESRVPRGPYRAILSLQDMVSSLSPCSTPSHVWMPAFERTGMVPSPDSIFVRSWPRALRFGCLSAGSERNGRGNHLSHWLRSRRTIPCRFTTWFTSLCAHGCTLCPRDPREA